MKSRWDPTRRELIALGGAAVATAGSLGSSAFAQGGANTLKVGAIFPSSSGVTRIRTSINDFTGDGARQGSLLAEQRIGTLVSETGLNLLVLQANAPTPAAAIRAAERLVEFDKVDALLGGVGEGQLEPLIGIAERAGVPLLNIGTPDDVFRQDRCNRNLFHVEPSDAMYLDSMVQWSAARGHRRWFIVNQDSERGHARQAAAVRAVARHGAGGEVVGAASTVFEQPSYFALINEARRTGADAILVILGVTDQIAFSGQFDAAWGEPTLVAFPDPPGQTRDFILALRQMTVGYTPEFRFQSWDPSLETNGAADFNNIYATRFAAPAEPSAWSSFNAVKMLYEAAVATGTTDGDALISHLETSDDEFDLMKGPGSSFRSWDHQLRQPVYSIEIDLDLVLVEALVGTSLRSQIEVASVESILPTRGASQGTTAWLDQIGDGPDRSLCAL